MVVEMFEICQNSHIGELSLDKMVLVQCKRNSCNTYTVNELLINPEFVLLKPIPKHVYCEVHQHYSSDFKFPT